MINEQMTVEELIRLSSMVERAVSATTRQEILVAWAERDALKVRIQELEVQLLQGCGMAWDLGRHEWVEERRRSEASSFDEFWEKCRKDLTHEQQDAGEIYDLLDIAFQAGCLAGEFNKGG